MQHDTRITHDPPKLVKRGRAIALIVVRLTRNRKRLEHLSPYVHRVLWRGAPFLAVLFAALELLCLGLLPSFRPFLMDLGRHRHDREHTTRVRATRPEAAANRIGSKPSSLTGAPPPWRLARS